MKYYERARILKKAYFAYYVLEQRFLGFEDWSKQYIREVNEEYSLKDSLVVFESRANFHDYDITEYVKMHIPLCQYDHIFENYVNPNMAIWCCEAIYDNRKFDEMTITKDWIVYDERNELYQSISGLVYQIIHRENAIPIDLMDWLDKNGYK